MADHLITQNEEKEDASRGRAGPFIFNEISCVPAASAFKNHSKSWDWLNFVVAVAAAANHTSAIGTNMIQKNTMSPDKSIRWDSSTQQPFDNFDSVSHNLQLVGAIHCRQL